MPEKVQFLQHKSFSTREVLLKLIADEFSKLRRDTSFKSERNRYLSPRTSAIEYLKETNQFRKQFQLCLKTFNGRTAETFKKTYTDAVRVVYEDYLISLGHNVIEFAEGNIKSKKTINLNFNDIEISNSHFAGILEDYFTLYGEDILNLKEHPWTCRVARIHDSSKTAMDRLEGKLRTIGQYGCLDQAIRFIELRIGLHGKYTYKTLVDSLDELIKDFLIDSTNNQINHIKARQPIDELVKEVAGKYEILNTPKYLVNPDTYKSVLRKRFNSIIQRS